MGWGGRAGGSACSSSSLAWTRLPVKGTIIATTRYEESDRQLAHLSPLFLSSLMLIVEEGKKNDDFQRKMLEYFPM
jgi:hypothetical protein